MAMQMHGPIFLDIDCSSYARQRLWIKARSVSESLGFFGTVSIGRTSEGARPSHLGADKDSYKHLPMGSSYLMRPSINSCLSRRLFSQGAAPMSGRVWEVFNCHNRKA